MRWLAVAALWGLGVPLGARNGAAEPSPGNLERHVDLDRDGRTELVQVTRGRRRVRIVNPRWAFDFPLPAPALDVVAADWVPGGALELVVATSRGVLVYAVDGTLIAAEVAALKEAVLFPTAGLDGSAQAVLVAREAGRRELSVFLLTRRGSLPLGRIRPGRNTLIEDPLGVPLFGLTFRATGGFEARDAGHVGGGAARLRLPLASPDVPGR